jgi:hypothetical protein
MKSNLNVGNSRKGNINTEKATPRPWRFVPCEDKRHHSEAILAPWVSNQEEPYHPMIVSCMRGLGHAPAEVAAANAALIVKAVNEYEALNAVAEIANSYQWISVGDGNGMSWRCPCCYSIRQDGHKANCKIALTLSKLAALRKESE